MPRLTHLARVPTWAWPLVSTAAGWLPGHFVHRAALRAAAAGARGAADRLLEHAALAYVMDLDVEGLAHARTHQLMIRWRTGGFEQPPALLRRIERRLRRSTPLESLEPPFAVTEPAALLDSLAAGPR